jgi:hypothetical protein
MQEMRGIRLVCCLLLLNIGRTRCRTPPPPPAERRTARRRWAQCPIPCNSLEAKGSPVFCYWVCLDMRCSTYMLGKAARKAGRWLQHQPKARGRGHPLHQLPPWADISGAGCGRAHRDPFFAFCRIQPTLRRGSGGLC